jgi:phosphatidylserine synthase
MSDNLIEQAEELAGCRWDDPDNPNALYALIGAVAREMGQNPHGRADDVAAGMLISKQIADEMDGTAARKRAADEMMAQMLLGGVSPDTLWDLLGGKE